ncbi:MAG: adenylyl-sulfate kinase [Betaproteobacteria bacterium]|nr:adenylyl-sulfate kinase [Betaproteobacteria bacterium]
MNQEKSPNAVWHHATVTRARRQRLNDHRSFVLWFTGLSGAGKSTLAHEVEERLHRQGRRTFVFDGDNVRHGLCADLGFAAKDRAENLRRIGEMSRLFVEAGIISLTAFISPFRSDRQRIRNMFAPGDFYEIFCDCPMEICEERDVKGMYRRARAGEIPGFTGVSAPYEPPERPDLRVFTGRDSLETCVGQVLALAATAMRGN